MVIEFNRKKEASSWRLSTLTCTIGGDNKICSTFASKDALYIRRVQVCFRKFEGNIGQPFPILMDV